MSIFSQSGYSGYLEVAPVADPLPLADQLRFLARCVPYARLRSGERILDASDFKEWLLELAEAADQVAA